MPRASKSFFCRSLGQIQSSIPPMRIGGLSDARLCRIRREIGLIASAFRAPYGASASHRFHLRFAAVKTMATNYDNCQFVPICNSRRLRFRVKSRCGTPRRRMAPGTHSPGTRFRRRNALARNSDRRPNVNFFPDLVFHCDRGVAAREHDRRLPLDQLHRRARDHSE